MKVTLSRIFETSKVLGTEAGQQLQDFVQFMADLSEQSLRALRNGLTFEDNMRCLASTVSLVHSTPTIINTGGKTPKRLQITRVYSTQYLLDAWGWYIDSNGSLNLKVEFTGAPVAAQNVDLLIFYE